MTFRPPREAFPVLAEKAYLNTGFYGPLPRRALEAMTAAAADEVTHGRVRPSYEVGVYDRRAAVRDRLARLLSTSPLDIALTRSTIEGTNMVVRAMGLGPGDEVLAGDEEHHAFRTALRMSGAEVREVPISGEADAVILERLRAAIGPETRLIALPHVIWSTGQTLPVAEIAGLGVPLLLDGAQSIGAIPVEADALGCDFLVFAGQKWLLGPEGTGGLYVRADWHARLPIAMPSTYGHHVPARGDDRPRDGAQRFEPGGNRQPAPRSRPGRPPSTWPKKQARNDFPMPPAWP